MATISDSGTSPYMRQKRCITCRTWQGVFMRDAMTRTTNRIVLFPNTVFRCSSPIYRKIFRPFRPLLAPTALALHKLIAPRRRQMTPMHHACNASHIYREGDDGIGTIHPFRYITNSHHSRDALPNYLSFRMANKRPPRGHLPGELRNLYFITGSILAC